jgi:hypothetical protein
MEKRREKWIDYFDLKDAFKIPGCFLCNRARDLSWKFLDNLFYERVTDVWTRVGLRKSKGFCNWHAWMSMEIPNSGSGIAIIYKDLLDAELRRLSDWTHEQEAPKGSGFRRLKKRFGVLLSSWTEKASCPICKLVKEHERIESNVLLDFIDEDEFSEGFEKSSGICIRHLIRIMEDFGKHPNLRLLMKKQIRKYQSLSEELEEFIRKLDYRFSKEPKGSELDSWKRAIEQFMGHRGIFGNEMDR